MNIPTKKANIYTYITKKSQHIYIRLYIWHISKKRCDDNRCVYIRTYIWISKMCVYIRTYIWISKKRCDDNRCHGKRRGKKKWILSKEMRRKSFSPNQSVFFKRVRRNMSPCLARLQQKLVEFIYAHNVTDIAETQCNALERTATRCNTQQRTMNITC